ncbi:phage baseplate upper protein [Psychrobacter sp. I-STPA10]|uniref:phage baseplate upper protein n=1 Tax=Psychrobacter sp. I-STPA10 TaxID=2585769 RepID=UPI001E49FA81|nr:phage baseplate upper protein [Psychrobacter sp. I-STPA10]
MFGSTRKPSIKEYDTLTIACQYLDDDKQPLSIADIEIKSEMRGPSGHLVDTLAVRIDDIEQGRFTLSPTLEKLPTGTHKLDILFIKQGQRISSQTFTIVVHPAITKP